MKNILIAFIAAFASSSVAVAGPLPNGTCKGGPSVTVVVKSGKIVSYHWNKDYPVVQQTATRYKIGAGGRLVVRKPKGNKFGAALTLGGRNLDMTFSCN